MDDGPAHPPKPRYRNLTEKSKALLFLLREVPYITMPDIRRFFYPGHKTSGYVREMVRHLTQSHLLTAHRLGGGTVIYYLTDIGARIVQFYLNESPRLHKPTSSFYYSRPPTKPSEVNPFFYFPSPGLEFFPFSLKNISTYPFQHTQALLELVVRLRCALRFVYVLWLDKVRHKKDSLHIPHNPDLLLSNDLRTEKRRVYVELENSKIKAQALVQKLDNLTTLPAEWYLLLCTSEPVFHNLGRLIRRILSGLIKVSRHQTLFFTPRAQAALSRNILIGLWHPSWKNGGKYQGLKETLLYRYDAPVFDKQIWVRAVEPTGTIAVDQSGHPLHHLKAVPYEARKPGEKEFKLGDLMNTHLGDCKVEIQRVMAGAVVPTEGP